MAKKLLYNGWKGKPDRVCLYCGKPYAERHEVFGGANRQISIREGFQIDLCREHHEALHRNTEEWAQKENLTWRRFYEKKWLEGQIEAGATLQEAVRGWMSMIGKNYLEEIQPE